MTSALTSTHKRSYHGSMWLRLWVLVCIVGIGIFTEITLGIPSSETIEVEGDLIESEAPKEQSGDSELLLLEVTPAPQPDSKLSKNRSKEELFFLNKRESLALYSGWFGAWNSDGRDSVTKILFGVAYSHTLKSFDVLTVSGDALLGSMGSIGLDHRWYFFQKSLRRLFLAAGLAFRLDRWRGIGDFGDVNNFQAQVGVGVEDMVTHEIGVCAFLQGSTFFRGGDVRVKIGSLWIW